MYRHKITAISAAVIIAGIASTLVTTQGAGSSLPSANTQNHKASPTITYTSKGVGSLTTNGHKITVIVPPRTLVVAPTTTTTSTTIVQQAAPVVTTTTLPPSTTIPTTPAVSYPYGVSPADMAAWSKVAVCEEGGNWHVRGSMYSGGLGISNKNWTYFSAGMGFPASAADATPEQQVAVAKKIQAGYAVPDQNGCTGSW